jgi:hypothetical protein
VEHGIFCLITWYNDYSPAISSREDIEFQIQKLDEYGSSYNKAGEGEKYKYVYEGKMGRFA